MLPGKILARSYEGSSDNKVYRSRFSGQKFLKAPFGHYLLNIGCREDFIKAFEGRVSQHRAKLRKMISWAIRREPPGRMS
jgi:hypothetical protein